MPGSSPGFSWPPCPRAAPGPNPYHRDESPQLLWIFIKASLLSTGGLGNLPFLQKDLTRLGWARSTDFVTAIAVGQLSPGPTGLWSISLGYLMYGWLGAGLALAALSLPPCLP